MHCDMLRLAALDFILRILRTGVMGVSFVIDIFRVHFDDRAADMSGLRVPRHVITGFESLRHYGLQSRHLSLLSLRRCAFGPQAHYAVPRYDPLELHLGTKTFQITMHHSHSELSILTPVGDGAVPVVQGARDLDFVPVLVFSKRGLNRKAV
jgi:hypothetical protein